MIRSRTWRAAITNTVAIDRPLKRPRPQCRAAEAVADAETAAAEFVCIGDDGDAPGDAYENVIGAEAQDCIDLQRAVRPGTYLITPQAIRAPAFPAGSD